MMSRFISWLTGKKQKDGGIMKGKFYVKQSASSLLAAHQDELLEIKELTGLADEHFNFLYVKPIERYVEAIQLVPASESYHHAGVGGMLQHIMEVLVNALRIRRGHILPPGVDPEEIEHRKDLWTYVVFMSALLHDAGKMITDVYLEDEKGRAWNLLSAHPQPQTYRVRFNYARKHKFHEKLGAIALHKIFSPKQIDWVMSSDEEAWYALSHFLTGDYSNAGVLHEIVQKADQASVAANLGGDVKSVTSAPVQRPLSERILRTLQNLVETDVISINRPGAFGFYAQGYVYFVVSRTLDTVKEKMRSEGQSVPNDRNRLMDELQQFEVIEKTGAGRAVFSTKVKVGDWEQNLKLLKVSALKVWPNDDNRPAENPDVQIVELDGEGNPVESQPVPAAERPKQEKTPVKEALATNKDDSQEIKSEQSKAPKDTEFEADISDIDAELDELDALIKQPAPDADEVDMSDFDDNLYDDYDSPVQSNVDAKTEKVPEVVESTPEELNEEAQKPNIEESEKVEVSRDQVMQAVYEKAKSALPNSVAAHNDEVLSSTALVEFEDPDSPGARFTKWLIDGIKSGSIPMNENGNLVHLVDEGLFVVSPRVFREFETSTGLPWAKAQREFQKKRINLKTQRGENIFEYEILSKSGRSSTKKVKGMLIPNPDKKLGIVTNEKNMFMRQAS